MSNQIGILMVSFGTTHIDSLNKTIEAVAARIRQQYPQLPLYQAFTSDIIRGILKQRDGRQVDSTYEALERMEADGIRQVVILPTHFLDGVENTRMKETAEHFRNRFDSISIGRALLQNPEDEMETSKAVWDALEPVVGSDILVLMGHGTNVEADEAYERVQEWMRTMGHDKVYVATVEGHITIEDVIQQMKQDFLMGGRVVVTPLMLVTGDHANHDMAGDEDSFVTKLQASGYQPVPIIRGLGEYYQIQDLYMEHLKEVMPEMASEEDILAESVRAMLAEDKTVYGLLSGIGVGPGDPENLTLKALRTLKESDVIILPSAPKEDCYAYRIVKAAWPEVDDKIVMPISFPMTHNKAAMDEAHDAIYKDLSEILKGGQSVAFLTIGDPTVYSTFTYMKNRYQADGGKCSVVNGITSFTAVAARLGISLGDGREEIHIIPAAADEEKALSYPGTKIFMKSGKRLGQLVEALQEMDGITVQGVSNCGLPNEKVYHSLSEVDLNAGYLTVLIVKEA